MIALIGAVGVAVCLALALTRLHGGPTLYDRALAASSVVTKAALIAAAVATAARQPEIVDVALALMLGGFVFSVAVLKFFRSGTFQAPMARARDDA